MRYLLAFFILYAAACSSSSSKNSNNRNTTQVPSAAAGASLYGTYCLNCHGQLAQSTKLNRSFDQIKNAILTVPNMNNLQSIDDGSLQSIALALVPSANQFGTSTFSSTSDGTQLYATNCGNCHGQLTVSTKKGRTSSQISQAINSVTQMRSLSTLNTVQIDAIAGVLAVGGSSIVANQQGQQLYQTYCSSCHQQLTVSNVKLSSSAQISSAISRVAKMQNLTILTSAQISAIAQALGGF